MVFYRKYRPQTIDELDSNEIREKLTALLNDIEHIPHAFLFTGPKGLGKTSTARIIAKAVNCTALTAKRGKSGIEPCNTCPQCLSITNGTNMDILEIDAASNRGIDEIRELKENITLAPISSRKKVYIIDEVHMLTTEAFNALLKTLEEPPSHALFLLCTTEQQKVPATILSRTFHVAFRKATDDELIRSFKRIIKAEKIDITPEGLTRIAALSDGGFRDGVKLLEELHHLAGDKQITPELIEEKYRITGISDRVSECIEILVQRDSKAALQLIAQIVNEGSDIRYTLEQVVKQLHEELLTRVGASKEPTPLHEALTLDEVKSLLLLLTQALSEMRFSVLPQLPFEIAVITWGERMMTDQIVEEALDDAIGEETVSVSSLRKEAGNIKKAQVLNGQKEVKEKKVVRPPADVSVLDFSASGEITPEWLAAYWAAIIQNVKDHNHTLAGVLRGCDIKSYDRKVLVIETAYAFHREKLDNGRTKQILEEISSSLTGNTVTVKVELKSS